LTQNTARCQASFRARRTNDLDCWRTSRRSPPRQWRRLGCSHWLLRRLHRLRIFLFPF